ncbi:acyl-CoA binding protein 6 [Cochliomyia hominivorax]
MLTFEEIVEKVKNLKTKPSQEDFLEFYGYYKQATAGDCNTDEPEDPVKKAMWNAWKSRAGMSTEDAKAKYVEIYHKYAPKYEN